MIIIRINNSCLKSFNLIIKQQRYTITNLNYNNHHHHALLAPKNTTLSLNKQYKFYSTNTTPDQKNEDLLFVTTEQKSAVLNQRLDEVKLKNILVYEGKSANSLILNIFGTFLACIICYMSYASYQIFGTIKIKSAKEGEDESFFRKILNKIGSENFRIVVCSVVALVGFGALAVSLVLTSRQIKRIYLLKGGKRLGIVTQGIFGRNKSFSVNLDETSFARRRDVASGTNVPFKIQKHWFHYLIDTTNGEMHEKILFDYIICLKRF